MSILNVISVLRRNKRFLISGHVDPEADTVGSQLALASLLGRLGKEAIIVDEDWPPTSCSFLPDLRSIKLFRKLNKKRFKKPDCAVIVDCPSLERIGRVKDLISGGVTVINIDHHVSNSRFGDVDWVDTRAAAVGEMIFELFKKLRLKLTRDEAIVIYTAILIDTGAFRYSNTTAKTHKIAAELIKNGLDTNSIFEHLFEMKSYQTTRLLALVLSTMKRKKNGKVVYIWITRNMLKRSRAAFNDAENFIGFARATRGCKVAIFFKETPNNKIFKVSFRSKEGVDVNKVASKFGGGGHSRAAGCTISANSKKEAESMILNEVFKAV